MREFGFDPLARFTRVASDEQARRAGRGGQGANQSRSQTPHGRPIQRVTPGDAAHTISAEQPRRFLAAGFAWLAGFRV
jgi:hypothetical protein